MCAHIRLGRLDDLPGLELIELETATMFPPSVLPPDLARPLAAAQLVAGLDASLLWVAEAASAEIAGFILCSRVDRSLHICEMDVRPSLGRRGLGTMLLSRACAAASFLGLRFATLTTFSHLPWNAPFYARRGFVEIDRLARFPHLQAALRCERDRGLENRIAMVRNTA